MADYLSHYAEPEARLVDALSGRFRAAVVVPACDEAPGFVAPILSGLDREALLIVVINARDDHPDAVHARNETCLEVLLRRSEARSIGEGAWLGRLGGGIVVIDRARAGRRLPKGQGVGLARKIGLDLALALFAAGRLQSRWLHTTDADATLPAGYLDVGADAASAVVYPFRHLPSGDAALDRAHAIYELRLRHYVAGLRRAGSPYAYHAIGSTLAVDAERYAEVRGMPKRVAGEDFHILAKLRKLGPIATAKCAPIGLSARRSARTPFGTGPAVARLMADEDAPIFEHPTAFELLGWWLAILELHAEDDLRSPRAAAVAGAPFEEGALDRALAALDVDRGLAAALRGAPPARRAARIHEWFDALRTLRFMHALREALPDLGWREARAYHGLPSDPFACAAILAGRT